MDDKTKAIYDAILEGDRELVKAGVREALDAGVDASALMDTMTGAMGEVGAISGGFDDGASGFIHHGAWNAGFPGGTPGGVGFLHNFVYLLVLGIHFTDGKSTGEVRDVAFVRCAPVHHQ